MSFKSILPRIFLVYCMISCLLDEVHAKTVDHFDPSLPIPHATHMLHPIGKHKGHTKRNLDEGAGSLRGPELAPLFPGYGTHFTYAYVGTPPQRQSLIVDTGSHYTAFPCTGCENCGVHTDLYFNIKNSSTINIPKCDKGKPCSIEQQYSEGSSWKAFKVQDKFYVGNIENGLLPGAESYGINFEFGCQTSETGLFQKQLADGIMGLSNAPETLPAQLKAQKVTESSMFALCFRQGGGILTLGGVDQNIHTKRQVTYAAMVDPGRYGWFGVNLVNVFMRPSATVAATAAGKDLLPMQPIAAHTNYLLPQAPAAPGKDNKGKEKDKGKVPVSGGTGRRRMDAKDYGTVTPSTTGAIVDSGTTDTYLPLAAEPDFKAMFKKMSGGIEFTAKNWKLTKQDRDKLPTIIFRLQAAGAAAAALMNTSRAGFTAINTPNPFGATVDIAMPFLNYLDLLEETDTYNSRLGFTEPGGAVVLGSNFMSGYNVIFDPEHEKIGFAQSTCNYEEFDPARREELPNQPAMVDDPACVDGLLPYSQCTAVCNKNETAYRATGVQQWVHRCAHKNSPGTPTAGAEEPQLTPDLRRIETHPCSENCTLSKVVRGDPACPDRPWSECGHGCVKSRQAVPITEHTKVHGKCNYKLQTSTCYAGICPLQEGDYLVYIDLRVRTIDSKYWSYVHSESVFAAMAYLFKMNANAVELLNDAGNEYSSGTKLHFKLRLKAKDYKDVFALHSASDAVVKTVRSPTFGIRLIEALEYTSQRTADKYNQISRFGWLGPRDFEVLSAIAMPTMGVRAPGGEVGKDYDDSASDAGLGGMTMKQTNLLLLGVALAAILMLAVVLYMHIRLRQAHALYEKDKISALSRGGRVLHKLFNTIVSGDKAEASSDRNIMASQRQQAEIEMSSLVDSRHIDEDLED